MVWGEVRVPWELPCWAEEPGRGAVGHWAALGQPKDSPWCERVQTSLQCEVWAGDRARGFSVLLFCVGEQVCFAAFVTSPRLLFSFIWGAVACSIGVTSPELELL